MNGAGVTIRYEPSYPIPGDLLPDFCCGSALRGGYENLLWSISVEDYGQIFEQAWEEQRPWDLQAYENDSSSSPPPARLCSIALRRVLSISSVARIADLKDW